MDGLNDELDILGHQPGLNNLYTQICLCFALADKSDSAILETLTKGLKRLARSFPWIAGKVVNEGASDGNTGVFKIVPFEEIPRLVMKDLRSDDGPSALSMNILRQANFPFSMLDERIICPRSTLPGVFHEGSGAAPVLLVQATFITGGLILTFTAQHNVMDMTGQGQVINLFSKACRNEQFTSEELSDGNLSRKHIISLLDSYEQGPEIAPQVMPNTSSQPASDAFPPPKASWAYFSFTPASLVALKAEASRTVTNPPGYISTDDALSALIWKSILRARLPRLESTTDVKFARAVDVRRYLGILQTYTGTVQNMSYHTSTVEKLVEEPLGAIASELRVAVDPKTSKLGYNTRALATVLNRSPNKGLFSVTATIDVTRDIMLSSWANVNCYELDFGLGLDKPEAVRRPAFTPFESLLYLMPKAPDGGIAAAICLRDEDMKRLEVDEEFTKFGTYVG